MHHHDGDDDNGQKKEDQKEQEPDAVPGEFNPGDDVGTRVGEGHDPVEDDVT